MSLSSRQTMVLLGFVIYTTSDVVIHWKRSISNIWRNYFCVIWQNGPIQTNFQFTQNGSRFAVREKFFISSKLTLFSSLTSVIKMEYEYSGIPHLYCCLTSCTIQPLTFENSKIQRRRKMTSKSLEVKFWSDNLKIKREQFLKNTSHLGEKPKIETASVRF